MIIFLNVVKNQQKRKKEKNLAETRTITGPETNGKNKEVLVRR